MALVRWKDVERESVTYRVSSHEPLIVRIDGKNFSPMTEKYYEKPLDEKFALAMENVARDLLDFTQSAYVAFTQSDEINLLLYPMRKQSTIAFGGKVQKIVSVLAARASVKFTQMEREALFDARVIRPALAPVSVKEAIIDYFRWRFFDGVRNSRNKFARYYLGAKRLTGLTSKQAIELVEEEYGVKWNDLPDRVKYGVVVYSLSDTESLSPQRFDVLKQVILNVIS